MAHPFRTQCLITQGIFCLQQRAQNNNIAQHGEGGRLEGESVNKMQRYVEWPCGVGNGTTKGVSLDNVGSHGFTRQ